eukprot:TRINITY_DN11259_c0_g1_i1.p1 TRINITY_DN11259_c0_g1~~TRINITY_DN11259_c0_g1_i1.p1  ORF type:complete len:127 (+),score=17.76 TRINITY_DN11259_c0_g1_i1:57-437(+)
MSDICFEGQRGTKKGWLLKEGGKIKSWKKRWFFLNENSLYYFKDPTDIGQPNGIVTLSFVKVVKITKGSKPHMFSLVPKTKNHITACKVTQNGKVVRSNHRSFVFSAKSEEEREDWMKLIADSITC